MAAAHIRDARVRPGVSAGQRHGCSLREIAPSRKSRCICRFFRSRLTQRGPPHVVASRGAACEGEGPTLALLSPELGLRTWPIGCRAPLVSCASGVECRARSCSAALVLRFLPLPQREPRFALESVAPRWPRPYSACRVVCRREGGSISPSVRCPAEARRCARHWRYRSPMRALVRSACPELAPVLATACIAFAITLAHKDWVHSSRTYCSRRPQDVRQETEASGYHSICGPALFTTTKCCALVCVDGVPAIAGARLWPIHLVARSVISLMLLRMWKLDIRHLENA